MPKPGMYCLGCYYDLRNLPERRCPECGRGFDPGDCRTFSATPSPERLVKLINRAGTMLSELPNPAPAPNAMSFVRQYAELARENAELRVFVALLAEQLVQAGVFAGEDIARLYAEGKARAETADWAVDDTAEEADEEPDEPAPELLELKQAAEELRRGEADASDSHKMH